MRSVRHLMLLGLFLAPACGPQDEEAPRPKEPGRPGLVFAEVPATIRMNGLFRVVVEVNDAAGAPAVADDSTPVTVSVSGGGVLRGTRTQTAAAGRVVFDDLGYDRWEPISLTVSAPGLAPTTTRATVPVRPVLRFASRPRQRFVVGEDTGKMEIELVDGQGRLVKSSGVLRLTHEPDEFDVVDGPERSLAEGTATYASLRFKTAGSKTLVWTSPGLGDLLHPVTVFVGQKEQGLWLPSARVGVEYRTQLSPVGADFRVLRGTLPKGLVLEPGGLVHGVATEPQTVRIEVLATMEGQTPMLSRAEFPVYAAEEAAGPPLDDLAAVGPYDVATLDDVVDIRARNRSTPIRAYYPARGGGPADGAFPLVVFEHGAGLIDVDHPRLYERFDHFLRHWASHGFAVVSVDATDLIWQEGRWVPGSLVNLDAMAENLRAAISHVMRCNANPRHVLGGHVDSTRIVLAGHSRGAAAALIVARAEPRVVGGVLIKPFDPANTVGGDKMWTGALPPKPFLLVAAGNDGDLPFPMIDGLFERRAAPMIEVTILGSLHFHSISPGGAQDRFDEGTVADVTRREDWDVTNAYAVAFLKYAALGDMDAAARLFGPAARSCRLSSAGVHVQSDRRADAIMIDDFQDDHPGRNRLDQPSRDDGMDVSADEPSLVSAIRTLPETHRRMYGPCYQRPDILASSTAHRLEWRLGRAVYRVELNRLDVTGRATFAMRVRTAKGVFDGTQMRIAFEDGSGRTASVPLSGHVGASGLMPRFCDVAVPMSKIGAAGLDLANLAAVEILVDGTGALLIDDLRFE